MLCIFGKDHTALYHSHDRFTAPLIQPHMQQHTTSWQTLRMMTLKISTAFPFVHPPRGAIVAGQAETIHPSPVSPTLSVHLANLSGKKVSGTATAIRGRTGSMKNRCLMRTRRRMPRRLHLAVILSLEQKVLLQVTRSMRWVAMCHNELFYYIPFPLRCLISTASIDQCMLLEELLKSGVSFIDLPSSRNLCDFRQRSLRAMLRL